MRKIIKINSYKQRIFDLEESIKTLKNDDKQIDTEIHNLAIEYLLDWVRIIKMEVSKNESN
jgi:hypothetical protein